MRHSEIIFTVAEDQENHGYTARALGHPIFTEADTVEELRENVRKAVDTYFEETEEAPKMIRLHFVRDEVLTR